MTLQLGSLDSFPYAMRSGRFTPPVRRPASRSFLFLGAGGDAHPAQVFTQPFSPGRPSGTAPGDPACMRCVVM